MAGSSMAFEEPMHVFRQFSPDPFRGGNLLNAGFAQTTHRAKSLQQQILPVLAYTETIVENTLFDAFFHEQLVIRVGETMRLVTDALEQTQRRRIPWLPQRESPA